MATSEIAKSAQLSKRSAVAGGRVASGEIKPPGPAVLTRTCPAPPVPVPPLAPSMSPQQVVPVASRLDSAGSAGEACPRALPLGRVVSRVVSLVAAVVVTLVVVAGLGWIGQSASPRIPAQTTVTQVGAGETVWDVARRVAPQADQRAVVDRIRELNGFAGSAVVPGQQLRVPDRR
jgi:hypothetical protein